MKGNSWTCWENDILDNIRRHLIVQGRVQGVWFRESTRRQAVSLGVSGWVKNCPDGTVEALLEGPQGAVSRLVAWCRKGPSAANVVKVHETEKPWQGKFGAFDILY